MISRSKSIRAYHFVGETLRDGSPVPANGVWLTVRGKPKLCVRGLHASLHPLDALKYAPGFTLCYVELAGEIVVGVDKLASAKRKIIKRVDLKDVLFDFSMICALRAADHAESVLHIFEARYPNDSRPRKAIEIAREVAGGTGDTYAAANAAYAAATAAAYAAANAAAAYAAANAAAAAAYATAYAAAYAANATAYAYAAATAANATAYAYAAATAYANTANAKTEEKQWQRDEFKRLVDSADWQ